MANKVINETKQTFMLQYILNARLSGRNRDTDGNHDRDQIVQAADDLYEKVTARCTTDTPNNE